MVLDQLGDLILCHLIATDLERLRCPTTDLALRLLSFAVSLTLTSGRNDRGVKGGDLASLGGVRTFA